MTAPRETFVVKCGACDGKGTSDGIRACGRCRGFGKVLSYSPKADVAK
jgi:DnaJ-class molecular chaperone